MAYLNVETESANFRVVFSSVGRKVKPEQIPYDASGILLEGTFYNPNDFFESVEEQGVVPFSRDFRKRYEDVICVCREFEIPVAPAVPLAKRDEHKMALYKSDSHMQNLYNPTYPEALGVWLAANILAFQRSEIDKESWSYGIISQVNESILQRGKTYADFVNLIISRRALVFAEYLREQTQSVPLVVICCDLTQTGVVDFLNMDPDLARLRILTHEDYGRYFSGKSIYQLPVTQYERETGSWNESVIMSPNYAQRDLK